MKPFGQAEIQTGFRYAGLLVAALLALPGAAAGARPEPSKPEKKEEKKAEKGTTPKALDPSDGSVRLVQRVEMSIHENAIGLQRSIEVDSDDGDEVDITCNFVLRATKPEDGFRFAEGEGTIDGETLEKDAVARICEELKAAPGGEMPGIPGMPNIPGNNNKNDGDGEEKDSNEEMEGPQVRGYKASLTLGRLKQIAAGAPPVDRAACEPANVRVLLGNTRPLFTVDAPADAKVTVYFPFAQRTPLRFDPLRRQWSVRVPPGGQPGTYTTWIRIEHASGRFEWKSVVHDVHQRAAELTVRVPPKVRPGGRLSLEVDPLEPAQRVWASVPTVGERVELRLDDRSGRYVGELHTPAIFPQGKLAVRIEVQDLSGRRVERELEVDAATSADLECHHRTARGPAL